MSFKSRVQDIHKNFGSPNWGYDETLKVCLEVDKYFKGLNKNPAKKFRLAIEKDTQNYI
jgi:hypothetical protein